MALSPLDDYIDGDVAYLLGLVVGRGTIVEGDQRKLIIEFPYSSLQIQGISATYDQETSIRLGLDSIRERLLDLLDTDIRITRSDNSVDLTATFVRPSMMWRNILYILENRTSFAYFKIPSIMFSPELPADWKREFVRGYADVAGNIRHANRYVDGRNRVRLDILNYPSNWDLPVQLCLLLQEQLGVPTQLITWGHPNLGRAFREHQLNVFAASFLPIGFSFEHKQRILEEYADSDLVNLPNAKYVGCPGIRRLAGQPKPNSPEEENREKLDDRLVGRHFDAYWQICKALGCPRVPETPQGEFAFEEELEVDESE